VKRDQKSQVIDEIATQITESEAIYAADYRGLTVSQAAALRGKLREADASFRIVKNTLTLRAAEKAKAEHVKELIDGPTAFTFVYGDPALAAKTLDAFSRQEQVPTIRGGLIGSELLSSEAFHQLARLPGRDQLNAQLAGVVASPITGLVRGLGSLLSGLAVALGQVQEKKAAEAPAEQPEAPEQPPAEEAAEETPAEPQAGEDAVDEAPAQPEASEEEPAAEETPGAEAQAASDQPETSEESESAQESAEDEKEAE
jgi:large subunit ribosomal protein L10